MSELTTPVKIDIPGVGSIESPDLYLKSEVDRVIADMNAELVRRSEKIVELQSKLTLASLAEECSYLRNKRCNYCSALLQKMQEIHRLKTRIVQGSCKLGTRSKI